MSDAAPRSPSFVLASRSASRRAMLDQVGLRYECVPADIDEREVEAGCLSDGPPRIAATLAAEKARAVGEALGEALVLGSDSLVRVGGKRFDKPETRQQAAEHLRAFSGQAMELHSAAALWEPAGDGTGEIRWSHVETARLAFRTLDEEAIEAYLQREWPAVAGCVGVFRIEGPGVALFDEISGDYFTILGMPLLPVLKALRQHGIG